MRRIFVIICALAILVGQASALTNAPMVEGTPVDLDCASAILVEMDSGQIIFEQHADDMRPVASVTKVMTILLALEAVEDGRAAIDDVVTVSKNASGMGGSQILLDTGETQTYSQLLKSVIVGSANDSAVALAEYLYGSEELFVDYMNERADELGMTNTVYVNCTGLPAEGQYTTARDVAVAAREMFSHPLYFEYSTVWLEDFDHGDGRKTQLTNTNKLTRLYEGCDGGKTGSTDEAGYCFAATAKRAGMRLIAVVLNAPGSTERFDAAAAMFDYGFANYRLYPVAEKGTPVKGGLAVNGGDADSVPLVIDGDLTLLITKGNEQHVELKPSLPDYLDAPVVAGQKVGSVDVLLDERKVASLDIVTADSVTANGFGHVIKRILGLWVI
ncbi:MAG: D-alanyl-D-alanine carboxypeptidase [Clostridia bacterium]|nr:D-alanyl-D-alanine carboxypeptidase [Clostridia bacterium]